MSSSAGWYPDPGGQPGLYRWWTGSAWTASVTPNPQGTPPPDATGATPPGAPMSGQQNPYLAGQQNPYQATGAQSSYQATGTQTRRRATGWWVAGGAALLAVVVAIVLVIQSMGGSVPGIPDITGNNPTSTSSPNICPPASDSTPTATADPDSGWISGGKLAYPALGSPWETGWDDRVPWGSLATIQQVTDQDNYDGQGHSWVASILVSDLYVGDGFASTKVAAETVLKCVLGTYYADTVVTSKPVSSAQHDVDGHTGWLIETQLSFDIKGLNAKGERVLLLVVQTGDDDYSLFYASVPDTLPELVPDARQALSELRVQ
ncbi:MAG: DUF2510 domain-containing protein [Propionicimonas sp.]|uniref:DUF2510 domain-containing protein n=1 Tax=Propionicimonas sp. TaxID=1955623 RepID=UPI003D0DB513